MNDLSFASVFLLLSLTLTLLLGLIARFNQRLVVPNDHTTRKPWSSRLNQTGFGLLMVGNVLIWTGTLIGGLRLIPIAIGGSSVMIGFTCLVLAIIPIISTLLWQLHQCYGLRQLAQHAMIAIKQRLPQQPTRQSALQLIHFAGQLCVATLVVGWGLLRVIAASGLLDGESEDRGFGDFFNYSTMKWDHGDDDKGLYIYDD